MKNDGKVSLFDIVENIVGKGENDGYYKYSIFKRLNLYRFQKTYLSGLLKLEIVGKELKV